MINGYKNVDVLLRFDGVEPRKVKKMAEKSRRRNAESGELLTNIDSSVSFEESSELLEGISRGLEKIISLSLVIQSDIPLELDPDFLCLEKNKNFRRNMFNVFMGISGQILLTLLPMYFILSQWIALGVVFGLFILIAIIMRETWWKRLTDY